MQNDQPLAPRTDYAILALLMAGTALLSWAVLQHQSLRLDEAQSLWQTSHSFRRILHIVSEDVHVPFYHLLLGLWQRTVGSSVYSGRILSLTFFVASIPAMYLLGKTAYTRSIGLFAAGLVALSPFLNWYGSEIRMYSLLTLVTILHQYAFVTFTQPHTMPKRWLFFLTSIIGLGTHYFFGLILLVEAGAAVWYWKQFDRTTRRALGGTAAALAALALPWIWYVLRNGGGSNTAPVLTAPTLISVYNALAQFLFGYQEDHINTLLIALWPLATLLAFIALQHRGRSRATTWYILACACIPFACAFIVSIALKPVFVTRYLIVTTPAVYLLLAALLWTYPRALRRIGATLLVLIMAGTLAHQTYSRTTPAKEEYAGAAQYLEQHAHAQDAALVTAPFTIYPLEYYYRGAAKLGTIPDWDRSVFGPIPTFSVEGLEAQLNTLKKDHRNVWVVMSYDQGYAEQIRSYLDEHFPRIATEQFSAGLALYGYALQR